MESLKYAINILLKRRNKIYIKKIIFFIIPLLMVLKSIINAIIYKLSDNIQLLLCDSISYTFNMDVVSIKTKFLFQ